MRTKLRNVVADHPFTILGTAIGVLFALMLWVRLDHTEREVQKIHDRVVVIENNIRNGQKQSQRKIVCQPNRPNSQGCRDLRELLHGLPPAQRHKVQKGLDRAKRKQAQRPSQQRPRKPRQPTAQKPAQPQPATPTTPAPPSGGGGGGSSNDDPSDRGLKVQVQTNPVRVEVRTPKVAVETPVTTVEVPQVDVIVDPGAILPLPK